jgi:Flp pilus assembly protein TadD
VAFAASPPPSSPRLADGLSFSVNFDAALRQAQDLRQRGEFVSASRVLGQLVIAAPNDARVIGEYGKVMLESGSTDDAIAFLERAVTLKETDWTLYSALGIAYDQSGKREAARAALNHALALKPGEPAVLSNLALSHIQAGELDEAERLLLQASEQEKDVPGLADKLAMVRSLRGSTQPTSITPRVAEPVADASPAMQTPMAAPPPIKPATPSAGDTVEEEPAIPEEPETETVAMAAENPVIATASQSRPIKTIEPDPHAPASAVAASPNSVRPPPKVAAARAPASTRSPPGQPKTAPALPRPAGVMRAVTRTATIPLVVTPPPDPWESMVRVSLPSPSAAAPKPDASVPADTPNTSEPAEQPPGWFDALKRWTSAVLGFISRLWA